MYLLLTGERKNAGEFLIAESARRLIERFSPDRENLSLPSWEPLPVEIERINESKALILCGGPAFQRELGRRIYPISEKLSSIKVPIIAYGLGWKTLYGDQYDQENFRFEDWSKPLLERIKSDFPIVSCRDYMTCRVIRRNGVDSAVITGCPACVVRTSSISPSESRSPKVIYTPARHPLYRVQTIHLMRTLASFFGPDRVICSFHEGWTAGPLTAPEQAANYAAIKAQAEKLGLECVDVSGSATNLQMYGETDMHIGYRVHAHFKFLSLRLPSFLIPEDSRGVAATQSMGMPLVANTQPTATYSVVSKLVRNPKILGRAPSARCPLGTSSRYGQGVPFAVRGRRAKRFSQNEGSHLDHSGNLAPNA